MSYDDLRAELRSVTKSTYIVNQKNPRTFDREWSIYCWYLDDSKETVKTRDDAASRDREMRRCIQKAKDRTTPENVEEPK